MSTVSSSVSPGTPRENIRPVAQAFGLLAAALLVLSILYGLFAWQAVQRERLGEVAGVASAGARATLHFLEAEQQRFAMLADDLGEAGGPAQPEAATGVLRRFAAMRPGLGRIDLLDAAGRTIAASGPWPSAATTARETALLAGLAQAREHEGLQLGPVAWRSADQSWLPVTQRLVDAASGRTHGFVVAQLRSDGDAAWHHLQASAHVRAGLVSDTGETLIQFSGKADEAPRGPFWTWLRDHDRPRQGSVAIGDTFDVDLRHYAFVRVDGHRITAFASVSQAALLRAWFERVRVPFLVFALALAGLAFATAWTHRQQRQRETEQDAAAATLREQDGEIRRQTALLSQTQRAAHVGGWELDPSSGRLYWTDETYRIHEVQADGFTPTVDTAIAFYTSESRELVRAALDKALRTGQSWDLELQLVTARGRPLWVRATGVAELDPRGVCAKVFGALQDVTERHRADERIRRLAHYDELTGLANRNLFTYHLGHVLSRAERYGKQLAVLFIDLDRFKIINDTLGHDTGDRVLETIARRLSEQMRASDLVARLSGDEFMVVVEEIDGPEVVEDVARKLLRAIEEPVQHQGQEFSLSGSIGIAVYPQDGRDQQSLLKHADIAMYRAKDQGKNGFEFYSSGMNASSVERFSLESRLKRAVVDQNQFVLHYQPKVSVEDGRIVGAEALVRWVSPDRGLIPPGEFIPLAEETGLIGAIGEWVLTNACRQAAEWAGKGLPKVRVAVNLSARQLYSPGFLSTVRQALADSGVNPGGMELEITESVMMHHVEQVAEVLGELKLLGVHVAVDDFGTGYSSLAYLKRLPLDSLKVDRSFVRDVPGDPDDEAITRAVVALAHSLRLKVVAEGVETEEQLGFLCELGCDEIQGFLFSRPVPAAEFEELLRRDARLPRPAGSATRAA